MMTYTCDQISIRYELFCPESGEKLLPLLVCLPRHEKDDLWKLFCDETHQASHPAFVLCPEYRDWTDPLYARVLQRLLFAIRAEKCMDVCRTYLLGIGRGAVCAWHMLGSYPRLFAGTIAIGGCGNPYTVRNALYAPVWGFHSTEDQDIHVKLPTSVFGKNFLAGSKRLHDALCTAGARHARYTEVNCPAEELPGRVLSDASVIDWLFDQDRKKVTWVTMVTPELYRLDDWFMSSCYLVIGKERALLIDTTMTHERILPLVRKLTSLPVDLALTHPHLDHMLHAYAFENVYIIAEAVADMNHQLGKMKQMLARTTRTNMMPSFIDEAMILKNVIPLHDGSTIDLGGNTVIEAKYLGGHTRMDMVFVDHKHHHVFTGDAVGSGYVVGVNYPEGEFEKTYTDYQQALERFLDYMKDKGEHTYYGGHFIQENSCDDPMQEDYLNGQSVYFVPLTMDVIRDMNQLCKRLLAGEYAREINADGGFFIRYGDAALAAVRLPGQQGEV